MLKRITAFCCMICLFLIFPLTVRADMGPKPSVLVHVPNPPAEVYYMDIMGPIHENANSYYKTDGLDPELLAPLENYQLDGWAPLLVYGTPAPIFGELTGEKQEDGSMTHHFSYVSVPDDFRLIISTADGVLVSPAMHRSFLQESYTYDLKGVELPGAGNVLVDAGILKKESQALSLVRQFAITLICTLLIEGIFALLFRIDLRRNWKPLLLVNLGTQLALTTLLTLMMVYTGTILIYLSFFPLELLILITEALCYRKLLTGIAPIRALVYGITANVASAAAGFYLWIWLMELYF